MNSLANLNGYSNNTISFTDYRSSGVQFDRTVANNGYITGNEGSSLETFLGIEILDISSYGGNVFYDINVGAVSGATVTFASTPAGVSVNNLGSGLYRISNLNTLDLWNSAKNPIITLPRDYATNFVYSANVIAGSDYRNWSVSVTMNNASEFDVTSLNSFIYNNTQQNTINIYPQITDNENSSGTYSIVLSGNTGNAISNLSSTGSGGTSSYNAGAKTLTISGTKAQVNSHLSNIKYWPVANTYVNWGLYYTLTNPVSSLVSNISQTFISNIQIFSNVNTVYFTEDYLTTVTPSMSIVNAIGNAAAIYTVSVSSNPLTAVANISTAGTQGGTSSYNTSSKTLTITGNVASINSHFNNMQLLPNVDVTGFNLNYAISSAPSYYSYIQQPFVASFVNDEIANMANVTRYYSQNTLTTLFPNTVPYIPETTFGFPIYTISLESTAGYFGNVNLPFSTNAYSYIGQKDDINNNFSNIVFYPKANVTGTQSFTYNQYRDNVLQVSLSMPLIGATSNVVYTQGNTYVFTASQNFTPTYIESLYLKANVIIMGGGGGGGSRVGGGGGGGGFAGAINSTLSGTYNFTLGTGGAGGAGNGANDGQRGGTSTFTGSGLSLSAAGGYGGLNGNVNQNGQTILGWGGNSAGYGRSIGTTYGSSAAGGDGGGGTGNETNSSSYVNGQLRNGGIGGAGGGSGYGIAWILSAPYLSYPDPTIPWTSGPGFGAFGGNSAAGGGKGGRIYSSQTGSSTSSGLNGEWASGGGGGGVSGAGGNGGPGWGIVWFHP